MHEGQALWLWLHQFHKRNQPEGVRTKAGKFEVAACHRDIIFGVYSTWLVVRWKNKRVRRLT
jgi:hypothetical protein